MPVNRADSQPSTASKKMVSHHFTQEDEGLHLENAVFSVLSEFSTYAIF